MQTFNISTKLMQFSVLQKIDAIYDTIQFLMIWVYVE